MPHDQYTMASRPLTVEVRSETTPGTSYTVTLPRCTCPDDHWRGEKPCKHIAQAMREQYGWTWPTE